MSALINKSDATSSEEIWYKLNSIAYKLDHLNLFKQDDIFKWLSGSPIHPPDYSDYIHFHSTLNDLPVGQQQQQPQLQPPPPNQQPAPTAQNPAPQPSPRKPCPPPGSKNKPRDPLTRAAHYASKRFTTATSKIFLPETERKNAGAPF